MKIDFFVKMKLLIRQGTSLPFEWLSLLVHKTLLTGQLPDYSDNIYITGLFSPDPSFATAGPLALTSRPAGPKSRSVEAILCRCHGLVTLSFTNQPVIGLQRYQQSGKSETAYSLSLHFVHGIGYQQCKWNSCDLREQLLSAINLKTFCSASRTK